MKVGRLITATIDGKPAFYDPVKGQFAFAPDSAFQTRETDGGDVIFSDPRGRVIDLAWKDVETLENGHLTGVQQP